MSWGEIGIHILTVIVAVYLLWQVATRDLAEDVVGDE